MDQFEVAYILREMALLIELSDPMPQKAFAYAKAAQSILSVRNFQRLVSEGKLEELPYIGTAIAKMITTLMHHGHLHYYEELQEKIPITLLELTNIPGLSRHAVRTLYETLHISTIEELKEVIDSGTLAELKIISPSKISKIVRSIENIQKEGFTLLYPKAYTLAQGLIAHLKKAKVIQKITLAGELRRKCPVIAECSFVATSSNPESCLHHFLHYPTVQQLLNDEKTSMTVKWKNGLKASLHIVPKEQLTFMTLLKTGSPEHVEALFDYAAQKEIDLKTSATTEQEFYHHLRLDYIPPEMRENLGEIALAEKSIPPLIEEGDLKGAFHCHTIDSDGIHSLEEMVGYAQKLKWEYIGISDHSRSSIQAHGLDEERLSAQIEKIHHLNQKQSAIRIFAGIECDILQDGTLDFPNEILKHLDFVIVSVHSHFKMSKEEMTQRIIKAVENPYTTIVGHLTGRLLRHRPPYELDVNRIIDACIAHQKVIELNSSPSRLDMDWHYWIQAKEKGLLCSINPDAHSTQELLYCSYGINMARKGWLEKHNVINTLPLNEMIHYLKTKKSK